MLICEDEPFIALDLAASVEEAGGRVVGPAASIAEAEHLLETATVHGAILDVHLSDGEVTPVAERLIEAGIPVIIQTGVGLPVILRDRYPELQAYQKPVPAQQLVEHLAKLLPR
ncbi:MAG TPA: response regulator [Saliniramus sp.]|nr:response regulator [Saliniramus sp.]